MAASSAWVRRAALAAAIALHAGLLAWAATATSATFDEPNLVASGAVTWSTGQVVVGRLTPPLLRLWAAWPVVAAGARVPRPDAILSLDAGAQPWSYADVFLHANAAAFPRLLTLARWAMIPWSCLAAWLVWRWSRRLYGEPAGVAGCWIYALSPTIAAHASLAGTDVPTMAAILAALYAWWRAMAQPSWPRLLTAAALIGIAHACKFSALLLWPVLVGMAAWAVAARVDGAARPAGRLGGLAVAVLITGLVVNLAYGGRETGVRLAAYRWTSRLLQPLARLPGSLPVPLPKAYLEGLDAQQYELEGGYLGFLADRVYEGARWDYYPITLACKLPLAVWGLLVLAVAQLARGRPLTPSEAPLLGAAAGLGLLIASGGVNIGLRYLLPVFPLGIILVSRLWAPPSSPWSRVATGLLVALAVEHGSIAPRYLTFINAAFGGPANYRMVNDSSFDWGQGLIDLRRWMRRAGVARVQLLYFGSVDPAIYGVAYDPMVWPLHEDQLRFTQDLVAISSYFLVGLPHRVPTPQGRTRQVSLSAHRALQRMRPVAVVGSTIFVFRREDVRAALSQGQP